MEELALWIDGHWKFGSGPKFHSSNPATEEGLCCFRSASSQEVDEAFKAAQKAFSSWSALPIAQRIQHLEAFGKAFTSKRIAAAEIISKEMGKPLWESKNEVDAIIAKVGISIAAYHERCPEKTTQQQQNTLLVRHKPHGVVAVFGPFNFPGHLPGGHIIPSLLAGNTVIFKPSEMTPLTGKLLAGLFEESGLPPGVFNLVQGGKETGQAIVSHPLLAGLFFTGSYQTGSQIKQQLLSSPGKILALEMGGNNPLVVWDIKDLQAAAYQTIQSAFITAGQRCTCARRLIVSSKDPKTAEYLTLLQNMTRSLKIGPYTDVPEPFMGPVISAKVAEGLLKTHASLIAQGGKPLVEMKALKPSSAWLSPGIVDVTSIKKREDVESFGPLLQLIYTSTFEEAIEEANNTAYGLSAGLLSNDPSLYERFYKSVNAGVVNWNTPTTGASSAAPFGGLGKSGNFRPSAYYAADYCSYPVSSIISEKLMIPAIISPGVTL
jgi:succinylglutamic semialdehyde dehydrogenase